MQTRGFWLAFPVILWACTLPAQAQVKLADRAYSMAAGPDCIGGLEVGCEEFPAAMLVKGAVALVLRENHDAAAAIVARVRPDALVQKIGDVRLHFYTHVGVVRKAGPVLAVGDRVYPSTMFEQDSYPFADWNDPDDEHYQVKVQGREDDPLGIGVYFKESDAPLIDWKRLQASQSHEKWIRLQLADGISGWAGPCTYDQAYACGGSRVEYARAEDTRESRLARVRALPEDAGNPEFEDEGDGDTGLPPPEYRPGDPRLQYVLRDGIIQHAAFSTDGRQIVTASRDGVVRVWNTNDGKAVTSFKAADSISSASFSPDGQRIVTANGDGTVSVWTSGGRRLLYLPGHVGGASVAEYSPDGARVVTGNHSAYASEVWEVASGKLLQTLQTGGLGAGVASSPDGRRIASIGWEVVVVHDAATGKELFQFSIGTRHVGLSSLAYAPDGTRIITGEEMGYARVWDATSGALLFGLNPYEPKSSHWRPGPAAPIRSVAISPDGRHILTVGRGDAHIWGGN